MRDIVDADRRGLVFPDRDPRTWSRRAGRRRHQAAGESGNRRHLESTGAALDAQPSRRRNHRDPPRSALSVDALPTVESWSDPPLRWHDREDGERYHRAVASLAPAARQRTVPYSSDWHRAPDRHCHGCTRARNAEQLLGLLAADTADHRGLVSAGRASAAARAKTSATLRRLGDQRRPVMKRQVASPHRHTNRRRRLKARRRTRIATRPPTVRRARSRARTYDADCAQCSP